jgi:hypothetical protein
MTRKSLSYAFAALLTIATSGPAKDPPKAELVLKDVNGQRVRLSELRGKIVGLKPMASITANTTRAAVFSTVIKAAS